MAVYETGTATGPADLITKLETFAVANGWTVNTPTSGKVFTKGGKYWGVSWDVDDIFLRAATGYAAGSAWNAQPGAAPQTQVANNIPGPFQAYHFFAGSAPDYLHVVIEKSAGLFSHIGIGNIQKSGEYVGGEYTNALYWLTAYTTSQSPNNPDDDNHSVPFDCIANQYTATARNNIRCEVDSLIWHPFGSAAVNTLTTPNAVGGVRGQGPHMSFNKELYDRSPSDFNQLTPLLPIMVHIRRASGLTSLIGFAKDIRFLNIKNLAPGELITIGSDEWLVFPLIQKTATWGSTTDPTRLIPSSGNYGLAYKRN